MFSDMISFDSLGWIGLRIEWRGTDIDLKNFGMSGIGGADHGRDGGGHGREVGGHKGDHGHRGGSGRGRHQGEGHVHQRGGLALRNTEEDGSLRHDAGGGE